MHFESCFGLVGGQAAMVQGGEMTQPKNIADRRQLFVDDALIDRVASRFAGRGSDGQSRQAGWRLTRSKLKR